MKAICLTLGVCLFPISAFASCEQGPFEAFFLNFSRDIAVQEAVVGDHVMLSEFDHSAVPEPVTVLREIPREELEWPLVPNLTQFERAGGSVRYETMSDAQSVTLTGDSGYLMTLFFTQDPCWRLQVIENHSM